MLGTTLRKKVGKNTMPTDRHKSSVSNGKGGEKLWLKMRIGSRLFEFTNVAEIEFKTC